MFDLGSDTRLSLRVELETWPLIAPFHITGYSFTDLSIVVVRVGDGKHVGRGEAAGVYYRGDTPEIAAAQIRQAANLIERSDRQQLQRLLPPGGARNALDCALWELEAQRAGVPVWRLAGVSEPAPLRTSHTLGVDTPERVALAALAFTEARALKLKLNGDDLDGERICATRAARPDVWLGVDANQGFTRVGLERLRPVLLDCDVRMVEQPFPIGLEAELEGLAFPIPIAADESVQGLADIDGLVGRFDVINIKLDKCGGLTEGLAMARRARELGLKVMVGNMTGTSWAMGPAFVLGQLCDFVDLDGPLFLRADREQAVTYVDGEVWCADDVWGCGLATPAVGD
jgi:L-Ala-D/L-Glu epimerase